MSDQQVQSGNDVVVPTCAGFTKSQLERAMREHRGVLATLDELAPVSSPYGVTIDEIVARMYPEVTIDNRRGKDQPKEYVYVGDTLRWLVMQGTLERQYASDKMMGGDGRKGHPWSCYRRVAGGQREGAVPLSKAEAKAIEAGAKAMSEAEVDELLEKRHQEEVARITTAIRLGELARTKRIVALQNTVDYFVRRILFANKPWYVRVFEAITGYTVIR